MASEDLQHTTFNSIANTPDSQNLESEAVCQSLSAAVARIVSLARRSDTETLALAIEVAKLKERLLCGEAGKRIRWSVWIANETKFSRQYVYFLAKIGSSIDPAKALKEARKGWREEKRQDLSRNHELMLRLIPKLSDREANDEYVRLWQRYRRLIE